MSTVTRATRPLPLACVRIVFTPASVSTRSGSARTSSRSRTNFASPRMPLPHISARLPSAL